MKRKRLLILAAVALALVLTIIICALHSSANQPPYEFITRFHGTRNLDPNLVPTALSGIGIGYGPSPPNTVEHVYTFQTPRDLLEKEVGKELNQKGLVLTVTRGNTFSEFFVEERKPYTGERRSVVRGTGKMLDQVSVFPALVDGKEVCVVRCHRQPTWLESAWTRVKGWLGQK